MRQVKPLSVKPVDAPAAFTVAQAGSIQALSRGQATEHQQRIAFDWLLKEAAGIGAQSFRAGDSHATAFMEGRRFVAAQIVAITILDINKLKDDNNG